MTRSASFKNMPRRSFLKISAQWSTVAALHAASMPVWSVERPGGVDYDAVVIGSGLGGLTFAGYMAKAGFRVLVLEHHDVPGGYATTFTRDGGRFTFDVSLHQIALTEVTRRIFHDLEVFERVKFVKCPELFRQIVAGRDITCPAGDPKAFARMLTELFPQEQEGIEAFIAEMVVLNEEVERFLQGGKLTPARKMSFPIMFPRMWASRKKSLADYLNEHLTNPELKSVLSAFCSYYGLPPDKLSGFYYLNATGGFLRYGGSYPYGGSQVLSNALVDFIERNGGEVRFQTRVDEVLVKNGKAVGVKTANSETVGAGAVVANCSAISLFNKMVDRQNVPDDYLKEVESFQPSISSFEVWMGLERDITDKVQQPHIFVSAEPNPEKAFESARRSDAENVNFGVCVYNNIYKDYSPPGTTALNITTLCGYEPWKPFETDYRRGKKQAYHAKKKEMADALIRRLEQTLIPGLSAMIQVRDAATPLTNIRYTFNTAGAIYGFEQSIDNSFMYRISNRTPIKGLYLASAWGEPGGGYSGVMVSGKKTFGMVMEDWGRNDTGIP